VNRTRDAADRDRDRKIESPTLGMNWLGQSWVRTAFLRFVSAFTHYWTVSETDLKSNDENNVLLYILGFTYK